MELKIDFITETTTRKMDPSQKCDLIISKLQRERIVVFEGGLNPEEEAVLISETMTRIDHRSFIGYKILNPTPLRSSGLFSRKDVKMTVIAPPFYDNLSVALV